MITHVARNADGHTRRLEGVLRNDDVARYPGGSEQRCSEIEAGASRSAAELAADLRRSQDHLVTVLHRCVARRWPYAELMAQDSYPVRGCPAHRLREVEMHHVDLNIGYTPHQWPQTLPLDHRTP